MNKQDWIKQYSTYPKWELSNMKKALQVLGGFLNTEEDNLRLNAIKEVLKTKKN